ncbi:hypothetical protein PGTUg99_017251 [Puccinia graminis f. sp. tritici]|uniref:Uncharacterized protein n=1 Tax=Puccinia graminis f. sp. tritici TaxID=56615 RepID=A0A5B0RQ07_PUCGR|nr:hypothetical protein PGTUg99_017251 [Puccinia graminis f. sp. tritici]
MIEGHTPLETRQLSRLKTLQCLFPELSSYQSRARQEEREPGHHIWDTVVNEDMTLAA